MILPKPDERHEPITIDLTGPEGNAFFLLARAGSYAEQIWGDDVTNEIALNRVLVDGFKELYDKEYPFAGCTTMKEYILKEMKEGDYEHLVQTFDKYFGMIVTLYR